MTLTAQVFEDLKSELATKGSLVFKVVTGSMEPIIKVNGLVEVQPLPTKLKRFDIVVFKREGILICHFISHVNRLKDPQGRELILAGGLKHPYQDAIPVDDILGLVTNYEISFWRKLWLVAKMRRRR